MRLKRSVLRSERGMALFATFLMLLLLLSLGSASLVQSMIDLRATSHYRTGVQALMAAESGAVHGLSAINKKMVRHFKEDIVDRWGSDGTLLGSGQYTLLGDPKSGYSVTVEADTTNPQNSGFVVGYGWAPLDAERIVALQVRRSSMIGTQGAIFLVNDGFDDFDYASASVDIDGHDYYADGVTLNPNGYDVPAITTQNSTVNDYVKSQIPNDKATNFQGVGYDNSDPTKIVPSVLDLGGPNTQDINDVINKIEGNTDTCAISNCDPKDKKCLEDAPPPTSNCVFKTGEASLNGADLSYGTPWSPAIIHLTNTDKITINGTWTGYGIIIADGPLDFNGTATFNGLIVCTADLASKKNDAKLNGTANINGSFWTYGDSLKVAGNIKVHHSSQALEFADNAGLGSKMGGNLPRQVVVVGWSEREG
jgi:hypothetical protein